MRTPALALLLLSLTACSATARTTAGNIASAVGSAAPAVCQIVGGGSVCGSAAPIVSDVAQLVAAILQSIPAKRADSVLPAAPQAVVYRGCVVTLPPGVSAADVAARLPQ